MSGLICGFVIASLIVALIFVIYMLIDEMTDIDVERFYIMRNIICVVIFILTVISINNFDKTEYQRRIFQFEQTKATIEQSLVSDKISGYERIQLVQSAITYNEELLELQWSSKQWYGWNIEDSVQDISLIKFE